ncbi:MAG: hypothetical protein A2017_04515 [Lentisphaerae bacterium GWF2_44_16]|nr:MAG: hypothetical protein A2017_04515 [Lentisphaerae bacterium GWF2_44_16]
MAGFNEKIHLAAIALLLIFFCGVSHAQQDEGSHAVLEQFKLPEYGEKDGKLKFILYGDKGVNLGELVNLDGVLVDFVREEVTNINEVQDLQGLKLYKIDDKLENILKFWKDKRHSKALISTPKAVLDKMTKTIRGNDEIHLRSPIMDMDGVGFEADYNTQTITVKKNVRVIIRGTPDDMRKNEKPDKKKSATDVNVKEGGKE